MQYHFNNCCKVIAFPLLILKYQSYIALISPGPALLHIHLLAGEHTAWSPLYLHLRTWRLCKSKHKTLHIDGNTGSADGGTGSANGDTGVPIETREVPMETLEMPMETLEVPMEALEVPMGTLQGPMRNKATPRGTRVWEGCTNVKGTSGVLLWSWRSECVKSPWKSCQLTVWRWPRSFQVATTNKAKELFVIKVIPAATVPSLSTCRWNPSLAKQSFRNWNFPLPLSAPSIKRDLCKFT